MLDGALDPKLSLPAGYVLQAAPNLQLFGMTFPCVTFLPSNVKLTHSYDRFPLDSEHFLTYRFYGW